MHVAILLKQLTQSSYDGFQDNGTEEQEGLDIHVTVVIERVDGRVRECGAITVAVL
jgi:hypothetical protein